MEDALSSDQTLQLHQMRHPCSATSRISLPPPPTTRRTKAPLTCHSCLHFVHAFCFFCCCSGCPLGTDGSFVESDAYVSTSCLRQLCRSPSSYTLTRATGRRGIGVKVSSAGNGSPTICTGFRMKESGGFSGSCIVYLFFGERGGVLVCNCWPIGYRHHCRQSINQAGNSILLSVSATRCRSGTMTSSVLASVMNICCKVLMLATPRLHPLKPTSAIKVAKCLPPLSAITAIACICFDKNVSYVKPACPIPSAGSSQLSITTLHATELRGPRYLGT